jgi:purine-binding chemotaxis protein CheW
MEELNKVVVFIVEKEEYAFPINDVISIEKMEGITPIPHLPEYVRGVVKVRGDLVPTIDLEKILYNRFIPNDQTSRMIVLKLDEMSIGILVNEAKDIMDISSQQIKQLGLVAYEKTSYLTGVINLESRLITIINPTLLVQSLEGIKEIKEFMKQEQK